MRVFKVCFTMGLFLRRAHCLHPAGTVNMLREAKLRKTAASSFVRPIAARAIRGGGGCAFVES